MPKNTEKRDEIMRCAYHLFTENGYKNVFLSDIAQQAGISKSLLQHYFPKKSELIKSILDEMLSISFEYVENLVSEQDDLYLRLSVYTRIFWESVSKNEKWNQFSVNVISHRELLGIWVDTVYRWLISMKDSEAQQVEKRRLKAALTFSITGGMEVYLQREELHIEVTPICRQITTSFMEISYCSDEQIGATLKRTNDVIKDLSTDDFKAFCEENINWLDSL